MPLARHPLANLPPDELIKQIEYPSDLSEYGKNEEEDCPAQERFENIQR